MPTEAGRAAVRRAVKAEMSERGWNPTNLADAAGIDPGTAGDFLAGTRWPKQRTQGKLENALGWPAGSVSDVADGAEPPGRVQGSRQDADHVLLDLPEEALEGLSPAERDEVVTAARLSALQKAREIRGSQ